MSNNIRSGQILSPFGIGQIINFPEEVSLMLCGLNLWDQNLQNKREQDGINSIDESTLRINEPRLERLLNVRFFRKPFPYFTANTKNRKLTLPAVRFPQWHYCTNYKCGQMREVELTFSDSNIRCATCRAKMIPVRFVAACSAGHIQDVPFREWVHNGPVPNDGAEHILTYTSGSGSGDLGSIYMKCSCGAPGKSLAGIMNIGRYENTIFDSALARIGLPVDADNDFSISNPNINNPVGQYCRGYRPWLGLEGLTEAQQKATEVLWDTRNLWRRILMRRRLRLMELLRILTGR